MTAPYGDAAWAYRSAGWLSPIPLGLRPGEKAPPPRGYTGWTGLAPSGADVAAWIETHGDRNIGLHLPLGVYALDVDHYGAKRGADNLDGLTRELGVPLPATWSNTARGAGRSRQLFFRVSLPEGRIWRDHPVPDTESLHTGHRYAVVWPSRNPDAGGAPYLWYLPTGEAADRVPQIDELAELPAVWVEALSQPGEALGGNAASDPEARSIFDGWEVGEPCAPVTAWLSGEMGRLAVAENGGNIRDAGRTLAGVRLGITGHRGVSAALGAHADAYAAARVRLRGDDERSARRDHWRQIRDAVGKLRGEQQTMCGCAERLALTPVPPEWMPPIPPRERLAIPAPHEPAAPVVMNSEGRSLDDIGNGERLYDLAGHQFRFVGDQQIWREWDGARWIEDSIGRVREAAKIAVRNLWREAAEADPGPMAVEAEVDAAIEAGDLKKAKEIQGAWLATPEGREWTKATARAKAITKWAAASQIRVRIEAGISMFTSIPGVASRSTDYDRHPHLFNTASGTLDTDSAAWRAHNPADMLTKLTPVPYDHAAPAPLWRAFLAANLPNAETRRYLQKLAGYSLTGRANAKVMAYLYGPSDTGKSIVAAVLLAVHGEYGYAAPKGSLAPRKHGDEGRDVDRHGMIGARFVVTSETRPGEPMDEALVKSLTGRDPQKTRGNYAKGNTEWRPEMLLMVCSNQYPRITGDDDAIWERIKVIPFLVQFLAGDPRRDERLQEKILRDELPGVLAWCFEGLIAYLAEGLLTPAEVTMATDQFRASGDGVARWLTEGVEDGAIVIAGSQWTERKWLFRAYEKWCDDSGITSPLNSARLYARLESLGYAVVSRRGKRGFAGVGLVAPAGSWLIADSPLGGTP